MFGDKHISIGETITHDDNLINRDMETHNTKNRGQPKNLGSKNNAKPNHENQNGRNMKNNIQITTCHITIHYHVQIRFKNTKRGKIQKDE